MIIVYTNHPELPEFKWVIHEIFYSFLGINYVILYHKSKNITIELENKNTIEINNFFLDNLNNDVKITIPDNFIFSNLYFNKIFLNFPILFGNSNITFQDNLIKCEIDLIGFIFFKLSCYEEVLIKKRDHLNRFLGKYSIFNKFGLNNIPVVNEYLELLKYLLSYLDPGLSFKIFQYTNIISCDVDCPYSHGIKSFKAYVRQIGADLIKRRDPISALSNFVNPLFFYFKFYGFDVYINGINYIISSNSTFKNKLIFNIIPVNRGYLDQYYSINEPVMDFIIKKVLLSKNEIGIHLSSISSQNLMLAKFDIDKFKVFLSKYDYKFTGNLRNHYLLFDIEKTVDIIDSLDIESDSTLGYADTGGFRSGICYPYHPYNFKFKRAAKFLEYPLHIMDLSLIHI